MIFYNLGKTNPEGHKQIPCFVTCYAQLTRNGTGWPGRPQRARSGATISGLDSAETVDDFHFFESTKKNNQTSLKSNDIVIYIVEVT